MTISKKLYTGFGVALFIGLIMGLVSLRSLSSLGDDIIHLTGSSARVVYLVGDINNLTSDILGSIRGMNLNAHLNDPAEISRLHEVAIAE